MEHFLIFIFLPYVLSQCPSMDVVTPACECLPVALTVSHYLSVQCNKTGELKREDILCCNTNSSNQDSIEAQDIFKLITVGSQLTKFDFKLLENMTNLQILNLSRSGIRQVDWDNCQLGNLRELDLSHNEIENTTKDFFICNGNIKKIGLHGNMWMCELFLWFIDWVRDAEDNGIEILHKEDIFCYVKKKQDTEPAEMGLDYVVNTCPRNCSCRTISNDRVILQVNCSGRMWWDFPEQVPSQTRILYLENNKIQSFYRFRNGTNYRNVSAVHLDNNQIASLAELEGIKPTYRFATLSLSGNRLTHVSSYIMDQLKCAFKLGGNPWNCNCKYGTTLRTFIIDQMKRIDDINNITCASTDEHYPNKIVSELSQIDLCDPEEDVFNILDLVNGILTTLIIVVLAKVIYDWWHFKHTGQLPLGPIAIIQLWKNKRLRLNSMDA
uniref:LRRNT domain-containing protein n=1 Tax=Strigamia maritima TaxID=126957 RepID=T1IRM8_STRMM